MSEYIRLQANGVDAFPDASAENTYRPNGTSVEASLVALEGQITTLGGVAGEAKTIAEQNSEKIETVEQKISDIDSSLNEVKNKKTGTIISLGKYSCLNSNVEINFPSGYTMNDFSKIYGYAISGDGLFCEVSLTLESNCLTSLISHMAPDNLSASIITFIIRDETKVYCKVLSTGGYSGVNTMEIYGVLK